MTKFDTSAWNGSPGQWDTAEAYCSDCLIDLNTGGEKTKDKCKLPFRKPGSDSANKNAIKAMVGGRGITAVDAPADAKRKAANWIIRMYPQAFDKPAPASVYKIAGKSPPAQAKSRVTIHKDRGGQLWFMGVYSNNFEDRHDEIITWEAHQEFAQWTAEKGVKPPIILLHLPEYPPSLHLSQIIALNGGLITSEEYTETYMGLYKATAIAQTEAIIPLNGFVFVVGKILDNKKSVAKLLQEKSISWGMSHGFIPIKEGNIINKYRSFEFTVLPEEMVANQVTPFNILESKETMTDYFKGLSDENRELIEKVLDFDAQDVEEATEKAKQALARVLSSKELGEQDELEEVVIEEYEVMRTKMFEDLNVDGLVATLQEVGENIKAINERLEAVETATKQVERSEDEKIAAKFESPPWGMLRGVEEKSENDEELLDQLKEKALGEVEVVEEKTKHDNPLFTMFWEPMGLTK